MNNKGSERDVFDAVADPTRRKLLLLLANAEDLPLNELTVHFQMGRTAVSKHLAILREASLVTSRKIGRETRFQFNAAPLREIQDWVSFYESFWKERLANLNLLLEEEQKVKPDVSLDFQFTSSIEKVWAALTNSDILAKWIWNNDFKPVVGQKFQFRSEPNEWWDGVVNGEVLKVEEPHELTYTWISAGETTTITWTLKDGVNGTTDLHFEQTGFSEETKARKGAIQGAEYAWEQNGERLEKVLAEL